jgi:hypothetical protein
LKLVDIALQYPLYGKLGRPHNRSVHYVEEKSLIPVGNQNRLLGHPARSKVATPTKLSLLPASFNGLYVVSTFSFVSYLKTEIEAVSEMFIILNLGNGRCPKKVP